MKNLSIGVRLGVSFGFVLVLLGLIAVLGLSRMQAIESNLENIVQNNNVQVQLSSTMRTAVGDVAVSARNVVLLNEKAAIAQEMKQLQAHRAAYDTAETALVAMIGTPGSNAEERALIERIVKLKQAARPFTNKVLDLASNDQDAEAQNVLLTEVKPAQDSWTKAIDDLVALQNRLSAKTAQDAAESFNFARFSVIAIGLLALLIGIVAAWAVTRSITAPIHHAVAVARKVAAGDLTSQITVASKDETGLLLTALKDMNEKLSSLVSDVRQSTDSVATAARQIAAGNDDLSQRTEAQASNLEETAASMEQIGATVQSNAARSGEASTLAGTAMRSAEQGNEAVQRVITTMGSISESSRRIADVMAVIDGIAFQTNLLALNAAVEAARAGPNGRGFAVVASEVRALAQRSATAAKEVRGLIGASVDQVNSGSALVQDAGQAIGEIVRRVTEVTQLVAQISHASTEQSAGVTQVGAAIVLLDQTTQQNAALVEESAAAAESLSQQANSLVATVEHFKVRA